MRDRSRSTWLALAAACVWLWAAPAAWAVDFDWVTIGRPGNACDPQSFSCYGTVDHYYKVSRYEVTNAQYAEFLNAKAASDPLGLYDTGMTGIYGGIERSGSDGSYTYSVIPGTESRPVTRVSFWDAARFVNWLHNGQGDGDTETGAYTLLGGTPNPSNELVGRNPGATVFLPSSDEWHKAAYYDTAADTYYDYPAGTDTQVTCSVPTAASNTANCGAVAGLRDVGGYPGSPSPNGTFDQGGNAEEWVETIIILELRAVRGGGAFSAVFLLDSAHEDYEVPGEDNSILGFRVAALAEDPAGEECGDGVCSGPEDALNCSADCPDVCGDGLCTGAEDVLSCPADCPDVCGDGVCTGAESSTTCAADCGSVCGDGVCNGGEGTPSCPDDCGTQCGDGVCNGGESSATCVPDCGVVCGDGYCATGESCPEDCGPACGNGVLEGGEQCEAGLPLGDTCESLGFDGGDLLCNAATCRYDTSDCAELSCQPRRGACSTDADCCSGDCRGRWFRRCR